MEELNEGFYCTKCQKICSGIECECTKELNIKDLEETPDSIYVDPHLGAIYKKDDEYILANSIDAGDLIAEKSVKPGEMVVFSSSSKKGKSKLK